MKKALAIVALAAMTMGLTGCFSLRTPTTGDRQNNVYYWTFFGISLESVVYGDGIVVK